MSIVDRILALATVALFLMIGAVLLLNRDSTARMVQHTERFVADALRLAQICLGGLLVFAGLAGLVVLWALISKRRSENMRQRDGSFPLQRVKVSGGWIYVDPNKIVAPAIAVSGRGVAEIFTADPDIHLRHAIERAKVSAMQALAPGDAAISDQHGAMYRPGAVFNNAVGKHLAGAYERPPRQLPAPRIIGDEEPAPEAAPAPPAAPRLTLSQVLGRATPTALLAGQDDAGDLAIFDPRSAVHAGVVGSTGTGKTSYVGYTLVAQALRTGYHVVLIDPKGGADWQPWARHAEWHASDPAVFPGQVDALWAEHERRAALLQQSGARTVDDIGVSHTLVVVEEYGDLIAQLRRGDRKRADATDNTLDRLMRLSRATGIHLLMIDQYPEEWSNQVLAGCRYLVVFKLGPNQGQKVGEYKADRLPDVGRFSVRGRQYNAWFAAPHLDKLLAATPPSQAPRVIDGQFTVRSQPRSQGGEGGATSGEHPMNGAVNAPMNAPTTEPRPSGSANAPTTVDGWYEWTLAEYLPSHPELLQVDAQGRGVGVRALAAAMAAHGRGDASQYEAMKGAASEVAKRLRAAVSLPGGERLGTDISNVG